MPKVKWICLTGLLFVLLPIRAALADEGLEKDLKTGINSFFQLDTSRTEIEFRSLRLAAASGEYDRIELTRLTRSEPRGLLSLKVTLYKDGRSIKSGQISIRVLHYDNVLVSTDRINRHAPIEQGMYEIERREVTSLSNKPVTTPEQLSGCWAKRHISKGKILTMAMIEQIPMIITGQNIEIVYRSAGFDVSAQGLAMQSGYTGDRIKVKNLQSRKIITATIHDGKTVLVASR